MSKIATFIMMLGLLLGAPAAYGQASCVTNPKTVANALLACTTNCGEFDAACNFGCEIGQANNQQFCDQDCGPLGESCLSTCQFMITAINNCSPLTVVSFSVMFGSMVYPVTPSSAANVPWQITGISVVFTEPVASGGTASLGGITATGFTGLGTNTLTWTFAPISIASVTAVLAATGPFALSDAAALPLNNGSSYSQLLKILWGDVNGDGMVTASDMVLTNNATTQPYNVIYDVNGDGAVNLADVTVVRSRLNTKLP